MFTLNDKVSRNVLLNCDHGTFIVNRFDCDKEKTGQSQWLLDHGNVSVLEAQTAYSSIQNKDNPIIFDIGANIGTFTSWMSKAFPKGKIYAFEPQRLVFQMICGNMAINNIDNVYLFNMAIGNENKVLEFEEPDYFQNIDYGTFSLSKEIIEQKSNYKSIVDLVTLDFFVEKYKISNMDFLKIDAEGMDLSVLQGASKTINEYKPPILIEHSDNHVSILDSLKEELNKYGYKFEIQKNNLLAHF
jgi:FkbM family methyltransferase